MMSGITNIDSGTIRKMLTNVLYMMKVFTKLVSKDIMECFTEDPGLIDKVITCDRMWIFQYNPETKRQSMTEDSLHSQGPKKYE